MNQIFIAPRSGPKSRINFEKTISNGYEFEKINPYLSNDDKAILGNSNKLYIWGNIEGNKSKWETLSEGDYVFFYQDKKLTWVGSFLYKTHNKGLADFLWEAEEGRSFEYVFFLKDLIEVNIPLDIIIQLSDYKPNFIVQGFLKLKTDAVDRLNNQYGSIPNFINHFSGSSQNEPQIKKIETIKKRSQMNSILTAIKTKPFILLAGISGTGKSRLVRTLAFQTCAKAELRTDPKKPGNFELIPVRPNWHDSSELMGYISRINGEKYVSTAFLKFISKAWRNPDVPFFLCLDEMNLAPVEQYFAEYLSIIETRQVNEGQIVSDYLISKLSFENEALYIQLLDDLSIANDERFNKGIGIPNNLVVIGTVNMDETTHSFSRKVLDRAMTFEINGVDLNAGLDESKNDWAYPQDFINANEVIGEFTAGSEVVNQYSESKRVIEFLQKINDELEGTPFKIAYRVRDEFLIYCYHASKDKSSPNWMNIAFDEMTSMKILSRIEGDESKTGDVLRNLQKILTADFKRSNSKLKEMETRLQKSGYTSYWS